MKIFYFLLTVCIFYCDYGNGVKKHFQRKISKTQDLTGYWEGKVVSHFEVSYLYYFCF